VYDFRQAQNVGWKIEDGIEKSGAYSKRR